MEQQVESIPVPLSDRSVACDQYERYKQLHPGHGEPTDSFQSLNNTIGLEAMKKYLDALDKLQTGVEHADFEFCQMWCGVLESRFPFSTFVDACDLESSQSSTALELAFLHGHPKFSQDTRITPANIAQAINSSFQDAERFLESRLAALSLSPSDQPADCARYQRYKELHLKLENLKHLFERLNSIVGSEAIDRYLDDLEKLYNDTCRHMDKSSFVRLWCSLLKRNTPLSTLGRVLKVESDESFQVTAAELAFLHQHPTFLQHPQISHLNRVEAIDCHSSEEANTLLETLTRPQNVRSDILIEGYNHAYKKSKVLVDPTLKTLGEYAAKWTKAEYMAPFTLLVAALMSGKTRLLMELSKHICVVYICIRPSTSSGHPPQSKFASSVLLDSTCGAMQT
ncbi:hypothetical protein Pst134EB_014250 [Puccinia striiformis f. sp. tritici]|nr:hypothetical protein Pst134EB_014250 [Puccinia striiformis f. sp. tritici]